MKPISKKFIVIVALVGVLVLAAAIVVAVLHKNSNPAISIVAHGTAISRIASPLAKRVITLLQSGTAAIRGFLLLAHIAFPETL